MEAGSTFFVLGNAEHGIRNDGEGEMRWLYVFPTGRFADVVYEWSEKKTRDRRQRGRDGGYRAKL